MSSNYLWNGIDIGLITNTTTISTDASNIGFNKFPALSMSSTVLTAEPPGFVTNALNFNSLPVPNNGYYCYTDAENEEAPPFKYNGQSIFLREFDGRRLTVSSTSFTSGSGTTNIPVWCNAVKIYYISINGSAGSNGTGVNAVSNNIDNQDNATVNVNDNFHKHYNVLFDNRNYDKDDNRNINHHNTTNIHENWSAQPGGTGGTGGTGKIGFFPKFIKFAAGTNNKIEYNIQSTVGALSTAIIKENNTTIKAKVVFKNGGNGGNGGNAQSATTANTNTITNTDNYDQGGDVNIHNHNNNIYNVRAGSNAGSTGSTGASGTVEITDLTTGIHLNYNNTSALSNKLIIYYFKYE